MRFRSTGLGDCELRGCMSGLSPAGPDLLVLHIQTERPKWHLRVGIERKDVAPLLRSLLEPSIFLYVLRSLILTKRNPQEIPNLMDKSI